MKSEKGGKRCRGATRSVTELQRDREGLAWLQVESTARTPRVPGVKRASCGGGGGGGQISEKTADLFYVLILFVSGHHHLHIDRNILPGEYEGDLI